MSRVVVFTSVIVLGVAILATKAQLTVPTNATSLLAEVAAMPSDGDAILFDAFVSGMPPLSIEAMSQLQFHSLAGLRTCIEQQVEKATMVWPEDPAYAEASMVVNTLYDPKPAAVLYAHTTQDVSDAVVCATLNNVRVTVAGGRHSYLGLSVLDGYLIVDTSNLTAFSVSADNATVRVGAGMKNGLFLHHLKRTGIPGVAAILGNCPSVGTSGYMFAGGFGSLTTMFGLACDQLVSLEAVLFNGTVVRANATHHQDLLWAACGGGGGFAVVTEWEIKVLRLPDPDNLHFIVLVYDMLDSDNMARAYSRTLAMLAGDTPANNSRFGGGLLVGNVFQGWYDGPINEALDFVHAAGLVANDMKFDTTKPSSPDLVAARHPSGVILVKYPSWITSQYMQMYNLVCMFLPGSELCANEGVVAGVEVLPPDLEEYIDAEAGNPNSVVNQGTVPLWRNAFGGFVSQSRLLTDCVTDDVMKAIMDVLVPIITSPINPLGNVGLKHFGGGAVLDRPADAAAFPNREALSIFSIECVEGSANATEAQSVVRACLLIAGQVLGIIDSVQANSQYGGYLSPNEPQWQRAYYGANYPRLQQIKAAYDPLNMFSKPFVPAAQGES